MIATAVAAAGAMRVPPLNISASGAVGVASAQVAFWHDGHMSSAQNGSHTQLSGVWAAGRGGNMGLNYEVRATLQAGTNPTFGTMGSWISLNLTDVAWTNFPAAPGTLTSTILFEIRTADSHIVVASGSVILTATAS